MLEKGDEEMRLHVGGGTGYGALTVFPVWGEYDGPRGYSSRTAGLRLSEQDGGPSVPVLMAANEGERPVLMLEGQLLEGGWQNRVLVRSMLVPARGSLDLEVACVEAGRWGGVADHRNRGRRASVRIRSALREPPGHGRQGEVWRRVAQYEDRQGANDTGSYAVHADRAASEIEQLVGSLHPLPGQVGVVLGIAGQPAMAEVFDSPRTLRREFDSIVAAAGMDALGREPVVTPSRRARRFLDHSSRLGLRAESPAGVGTTLRGRGDYAEVAALSWQRRMVHQTMNNPRHPLNAGVGL